MLKNEERTLVADNGRLALKLGNPLRAQLVMEVGGSEMLFPLTQSEVQALRDWLTEMYYLMNKTGGK